jgi:polar amino acid transport system ATP-binding protein
MLFDEVTAALDPETDKELLNTNRELAREGMTCILVTHEMRFAREIADEVLFTDGGKIVEAGPPAELFDRPRMERTKAFLSQVL